MTIFLGFLTDLIIIGLMVLAFNFGKKRELPRQLIRLIAWVTAFIISIIGTPILLPIIEGLFSKLNLPENSVTKLFKENIGLQYSLIFLLIFIIIRIIVMMYNKKIEKLYPDLLNAEDAQAFSESALERRRTSMRFAGIIAALMVLMYLIILQPMLPIISKTFLQLSPQIISPRRLFEFGHNATQDASSANSLFKGPIWAIHNGFTHSFILKMIHILSPLTYIIK